VDKRTCTLRPIGRVTKGRPRQDSGQDWPDGVAEIEIDQAWVEALDGIEGFSHVWVVWWLDGYEDPPTALRVRPGGRQEMPLKGIFATRSPRRPNPIAMTAVRLLERRQGRITVEALDAFEGTPILDIKPYLRRGDLIPEATAPDWLEHMWNLHDEERTVGE
jgi:tRNA-Thr(GGU) m(6)t(6)A37 methyltransferase TsaA